MQFISGFCPIWARAQEAGGIVQLESRKADYAWALGAVSLCDHTPGVQAGPWVFIQALCLCCVRLSV